jgi:hypothetical protein
MKKSSGDEPIWVIIHRETPCVAILNKQKCHFSPFSSTKLENRRTEQVLPGAGGGGVGTSGREEVAEKG